MDNTKVITMDKSESIPAIEKALIGGDLSGLTQEERISYYNSLCKSLGLNPLTRPFEYLRPKGPSGPLILYANKNCAEQLRSLQKISIKIVETKVINDVYLVIVEAINGDGRADSSTGAIYIGGKKGVDLANEYMKCETKAKRRVTLSICGLGMMDETEAEDIKGAQIFKGESLKEEPKILPPINHMATPEEISTIWAMLRNELFYDEAKAKSWMQEIAGKQSSKEFTKIDIEAMNRKIKEEKLKDPHTIK